VVITGAGWVTPLGTGIQEVWQSLIAGQSGVGPLTLFDASQFPVRLAAEVRDWSIAEAGEDPADWVGHPRQTLFSVGAAKAAFKSAGLDDALLNPLRLGVYLGCGEVYPDFEQFAQMTLSSLQAGQVELPAYIRQALDGCDPEIERQREVNLPACYLAGLFNAQGPNVNCVAACVSASQAIGEAAELIRYGRADAMLAGGAHSMINPFAASGFFRLSVLSQADDPQQAMRPFDRDRDGFVIGEGAGVVVLEELEHARRRGAQIWGELTGFGSAQDAYRITDSHPEGRGTTRAIAQALDDAQLNIDEIDYINAHGTSTVLNDKMETLALKQIFGRQAYKIPISSTKSMLGHATTACGALELIVAVMALRTGVLPPTIHYHTPDPDCDLDYVPNAARQTRPRHVLSNSFGFGGQNVALIVSRFQSRKRR
jgi:3-oxoacyl-[acyl-carrier-protein] synthase II